MLLELSIIERHVWEKILQKSSIIYVCACVACLSAVNDTCKDRIVCIQISLSFAEMKIILQIVAIAYCIYTY